MRSSRNGWKVFVKVFAVAAAFLVTVRGLDFLLYPCTFIRSDIYAVCENQMEDIYLGTSHGRMNIDPEMVEEETGRKGHNLCVGGEYSIDAYYLTKLLIEKSRPSRIIYEVSPGYFISEKEEGNNYLLFFHEFPLSRAKLEYFHDSIMKCNFRTIFFPWYEYPLSYEIGKIQDTVYQKWNHNYDPEYLKGSQQEYHANGFIERYPVDTSELSMEEMEAFEVEKVKAENVEYLRKLIRLCQDHDIEFVAVSTPMPVATLAEYKDSFLSAWRYFSDIFEEYDVEYINFNREYYEAASHEITEYTDYDGHMHGEAARKFSQTLGRILSQ